MVKWCVLSLMWMFLKREVLHGVISFGSGWRWTFRSHSCGVALFKLNRLIQFGWIFAMNTSLLFVTNVVSLVIMVTSALLGVEALKQLFFIGINMAHGFKLYQYDPTSLEGVMRTLMMVVVLTLNHSRRCSGVVGRRRGWPSMSLHIMRPRLSQILALKILMILTLFQLRWKQLRLNRISSTCLFLGKYK